MNLVTGATGHIGNVLVRQLVEKGEKVRALILRGEDLLPLKGLDVETVIGDVLDCESLRTAFEGVQKVFHLAGIISIMPGKNELVRRVNVEGTCNVLRTAIQTGVRRLIYTSSIHAIVRTPHGVEIDERLPFDPNNPVGEYDRSKAEATLAVQEAVKHGLDGSFLDAVIVCPTGVIGPYDYRGSEMGQLIRDCAERKPQLYVDGAYDFVDVRDVARGLILASEKGRPGESYILSGEHITVPHLLEAIGEITGKSFFSVKVPLNLAHAVARIMPLYYRLTNTKPRITPYALETLRSNSTISHAKAERELGYQPRPLREALTDTIRWFRENRKMSKAAE
jgi:dihydroflavonol-4-reductase